MKNSLVLQKSPLYGAVTPATTRALNRVDDLAPKVLENIGDVADRVAVGEEVPSASAVAVIVEPGAENEVGGGNEKQTGEGSAAAHAHVLHESTCAAVAYMMMNQVKKPQ